jgi:hemerythrin-like domain-containing protein
MPIKRDELLAPLSREHHHGLLLCWKIRTGFRKNIPVERIQSYADWFYKNHLLDHFEIEEKYVFSVLGNEHELVKRALKEHRQLRRLFNGVRDEEKNLGLIEEKLDAHIRFEERVLFNEIQATASPAALEEISARHSSYAGTDTAEEWPDEFWK